MSLSLTYDDENIFAKIIRGEMPATKIDENDEVLAFMDLFPQSYGHCLVIPKNTKSTNILDTPTADLQQVIGHVQRIAKAVKDALNPDGIRIVQFNGSDAGQTVFHLHFHIIPVFKDQGLQPHGSGGRADTEQLRQIAEKISARL